MEGISNFACLDDNNKELDYGTIDRDFDNSFYSSKLVIDFSKEDSPNIEQLTYKSPTKRIEFETSRGYRPETISTPSNYNVKNDVPEFPTRTTRFGQRIRNSCINRKEAEIEKTKTKQKRKQLFILYCIGSVLVAIGITLIVVGAVSNLKRRSDNDDTLRSSPNGPVLHGSGKNYILFLEILTTNDYN